MVNDEAVDRHGIEEGDLPCANELKLLFLSKGGHCIRFVSLQKTCDDGDFSLHAGKNSTKFS